MIIDFHILILKYFFLVAPHSQHIVLYTISLFFSKLFLTFSLSSDSHSNLHYQKNDTILCKKNRKKNETKKHSKQNKNSQNGDGAVRNGACLEPRVIAKAPDGQGCPRCGGFVYMAEQMLARGRVSISFLI